MADESPSVYVSSLADDPDIGPIVPQFVARLPAQVAKLRELMAAGDTDGLCKLLHQLRGSGKSYGFAPMTELAAAAEELLLTGNGISHAAQLMGGLLDYIVHVKDYPHGSSC